MLAVNALSNYKTMQEKYNGSRHDEDIRHDGPGLPCTIQDTTRVTRKLGLRFI
jgi:hypothetical protein